MFPCSKIQNVYTFCTFYVVAGGMNGSIVHELERPENAGLKKSVKACSVSLFSQSHSITSSITIIIWIFPHNSMFYSLNFLIIKTNILSYILTASLSQWTYPIFLGSAKSKDSDWCYPTRSFFYLVTAANSKW